MDWFRVIRRLWLYGFLAVICLQCNLAEAQSKSSEQVVLDSYQSSKVLSLLFEKGKVKGSPYLVSGWLNGVVELSDHQKISAKDQKYLFNYDKLHIRVYVINTDEKVWYYPIDSISSFDFQDGTTHYQFEKIHSVSSRFLLIPIIESEKGYSLYKRLITEYRPADFVNTGYYKDGKNYDEFIDTYEYYVLFPGEKKFKKLFLKEKSIVRILKNESALVNAYFEINSMDFNEQTMLGLIQFINEKKYED